MEISHLPGLVTRAKCVVKHCSFSPEGIPEGIRLHQKSRSKMVVGGNSLRLGALLLGLVVIIVVEEEIVSTF